VWPGQQQLPRLQLSPWPCWLHPHLHLPHHLYQLPLLLPLLGLLGLGLGLAGCCPGRMCCCCQLHPERPIPACCWAPPGPASAPAAAAAAAAVPALTPMPAAKPVQAPSRHRHLT
jgi:hypothetical protein